MEHDPFITSAVDTTNRGDVSALYWSSWQPPEGCGRMVADDRAGAALQNSNHGNLPRCIS